MSATAKLGFVYLALITGLLVIAWFAPSPDWVPAALGLGVIVSIFGAIYVDRRGGKKGAVQYSRVDLAGGSLLAVVCLGTALFALYSGRYPMKYGSIDSAEEPFTFWIWLAAMTLLGAVGLNLAVRDVMYLRNRPKQSAPDHKTSGKSEPPVDTATSTWLRLIRQDRKHENEPYVVAVFGLSMIFAAMTAYWIGSYFEFEMSRRIWIGIAIFLVYLVVLIYVAVWYQHRRVVRKLKSASLSPGERMKLLDSVTSGAFSRLRDTPEYKAAESWNLREHEAYIQPILDKIERMLESSGEPLSESDKRAIDADLKELEKRLQWLNKK